MNVLVIILIIVGVILLGCAGLCAGCLYTAGTAAQQGLQEGAAFIELLPTRESAAAAVRTDAKVIEQLGEPIAHDGLYTREGSGEIKPAGETFTFNVSGPKGTAKVTASALKDASGTWQVTVITVQCSDGTTLTVPPPTAEAPTMDFGDVPSDVK
jgi:hypothetical protein